MKSIVGLFLGIVLQISQIQTSVASAAPHPARSCGTLETRHTCCSGKNVCACSSDSGKKEAPQPVTPIPDELKVPPSTCRDLAELEIIAPPAVTAQLAPTADLRDDFTVYAGVPVSVAYCSFVI